MENIIIQLGLFFALSSIAAVIFMYLKQSTILAYITVGIILGFFKSVIKLDQHIIEIISEIGIILLLYLAGMELDLSHFKKRLRQILFNGLGQITIFTVIGAVVGVLLLRISSITTAIYFGLCLTFSSTIIVITLLKNRKEVKSSHGQNLIGILLMQDITAVFALVFLKSLSSNQAILLSVIVILLKMAALLIVMFLFSRYILNYVFKKFSQSPELLFIGSLGYVLGVAALCESMYFSPELGAFITGVTLANIPYKLEIEDKVEPIKNLGVILFFVTLGFNLNITQSLVYQIPFILIISFIVLLGTPLIILLLAYLQRIKPRPAFFTGVMMNQISEFSLILATLSLQAGIFSQSLFTIVVFSSILSILFSSMGHSIIENLYSRFKKPLKFLEKRSIRIEDMEELAELKLKDHIVLLEYNELIDIIADDFAEKKIHSIILDLDPFKIRYIEENESEYHHAIYADPIDPDIWEEVKIKDASLIISGIEENHEAELFLLNYLKENNSEAIVIIHSSNYEDALEMYENNASYVVVPLHLAGESITEYFKKVNYDFKRMEEYKEQYRKKIEDIKKKFIM